MLGRNYLWIVFFCWGSFLYAQDKPLHYLVPGKIVGKDTIPWITLPTVEIYGTLTPEDQAAIQQYRRLQFNILKVYPYARFAAAKFNEINQKAQGMSNHERKKYIKEEEKKAKDQFEAELKQLTYSQGKILIKLVDRETGKTSYELVKELRGSFHAFLWQGLARLFTANLKAQYDSAGDDRAIEQIVRRIERGELK